MAFAVLLVRNICAVLVRNQPKLTEYGGRSLDLSGLTVLVRSLGIQQGHGETPQYQEWWTRPRGLKSGSERMTTVRGRKVNAVLTVFNQ